MAVKPITNKSIVATSGIRRDAQKSTKDINSKTGNRSESYLPGNNLSDNFSITLKDIDTSIMNYVKNVIRPVISEASENIKVNVIYGNENIRQRASNHAPAAAKEQIMKD